MDIISVGYVVYHRRNFSREFIFGYVMFVVMLLFLLLYLFATSLSVD